MDRSGEGVDLVGVDGDGVGETEEGVVGEHCLCIVQQGRRESGWGGGILITAGIAGGGGLGAFHLVAHRLRVEEGLLAEVGRRLVAVHDVDALAEEDVAQQRQEEEAGRQRDGARGQLHPLEGDVVHLCHEWGRGAGSPPATGPLGAPDWFVRTYSTCLSAFAVAPQR